MWKSAARTALMLLILIAVSFVTASTAFGQQLPTPNEPILVVQSSASSDPYQNFVPELLTTEGLNGFQTAQLSSLTESFLASYQVVVLPHLALTSAQATLFSDYVNAGGTLIGFRPDQQLAAVFGVSALGTTVTEGWLQINTATPYGAGLVSQVIRFHGTADAYGLLTASSLGTLYSSVSAATPYPAATVNSYGSGHAILFTFDLTQSIVLLRQGNPAWAGYPNDHDGFNTMRASQMFMDQNSGQYWNDMGDNALDDVPQADEEMRLFSNALVLASASKAPMPRFWYFPNQNRALLLMTGDDHSYPVSDALSEVNNIASYGGLFSYNLWYPFGTVSKSQVTSWLSAGDSMGVHFDDTAEVDSSAVGGSQATWNGMQGVMTNALASFKTTYPSATFPVTTRDHFLIWVSNDANGTADQTAQAKLFQSFGIQLDTSYSSFPDRWGYMTGSGLPMQFLDTVSGTVIPVYEQATQYEDDIQLQATPYGLDWGNSTAEGHYIQSLSDSLTIYNTVITMLNHPENWSADQTPIDAALQYAKSNAIPISTTGSWLSFWQARAAATMSNPSFSNGTLSFSISGAPAGLTLLLPEMSGVNCVTTFTVDGTAQSYTVGTYQGVAYASVVLAAGSHNISVLYNAGGSIGGQVSQAAAASTTIQAVGGPGGSVTQSTQLAADGTYTLGPLPAGTYTITPNAPGYEFTPSSQSLTLGSTNVTGINFTAIAVTSATLTIDVNTSKDQGTASATVVSSAFSTASPNELLLAFVSSDYLSGANSTVTGVAGGGLTWTLVLRTNVQSGTAEIWRALAPTQLSNVTVTATLSQKVGSSMTVMSFIGADATGTNGSGAIGAAQSASASSGAPTATLVTTRNGSWVLGVGADWDNAIARTVGTGQALVHQYLSPSGDTYWVQRQNAVTPLSATSVTINDTAPTGDRYDLSAVEVLPAISSGSSTYAISGTISGGSGSTVTLSVSGATVGTTTANSSGAYTFGSIANGAYTVTPSLTNYTFTPPNTLVTVADANISGVNFTANPPATYTISGTISGGSGSTVTLSVSGATVGTATANGSGTYTFSSIANGAYTVTPSLTNYTFTPPNTLVTVADANVSGVNFTANPPATYTISGTISGGSGSTVTLSVSGATVGTTTANGSGAYTFSSIANGAYTVTPSLTNYTFTPPNTLMTVSGANVSGVNFTANPPATYTISGTISGTGGNGATVTLSGAASASTTASSSGAFSFAGFANGSYVVTPTHSGYTFSPASAPTTVSNANVSNVNFTASTASSQGIAVDAKVSTDGSTASTTIKSAAFSTVSANELLLAFVSTDGPSSGTNTTVSSVSGGSLTWALVVRTNTQAGTAEIWRAFATATLSSVTVTATLSKSETSSITVMSFSGVNTSGTSGSGAIGATQSANASSGAPTSKLTTTQNGSLVIGVGNDWDNAIARTVGATQTLIHQDLAPVGDTYWVQMQNAATPLSGTSVTINDTAPTSDRYNLSICEILAAP